MKKLSNKGVTLVELIVSFAIVGVAIIYFFQTLYTVKKIYSISRNDTQMFVDENYALRIVDEKFQSLETITSENIFDDDITKILNICKNDNCTKPEICKVNDSFIAIIFDFEHGNTRYHEVLYEYTNKNILNDINKCIQNKLSPNTQIVGLFDNGRSSKKNTTTKSKDNATSVTKTTTTTKKATTTTVKTTTKKSVKSDIFCPTFTYSKDNKKFTSNPDSVYNSSKVYVKISMDNTHFAYNKWYWYSDNGKGGFSKWSKEYEKNNHVVNISGEGNRKIRTQVFNTNTNKSKNCDSKTIKIDRTAPNCPTIKISASKADSTWYKTNVKLSIKPTSDTIKWEWYTNNKDGSWKLWSSSNKGQLTKTLSDDDARVRQGKIVVYDKAGNKKNCYTDKYKIDKTLAYVTGKLIHPTKNVGSWSDGTRTSSDHLHYSKSYGGIWHGGNDITVSKGTTVVAMDGGEVIKADTSTNRCSNNKNESCKSENYVHFGKFVLLKHRINGKNYYTVYGHLNKISVSVGNKVKQGQKIGLSGNTGNSSGPHLHVGMSYNKYDNNGYPIYSKNVIAPYVYISGSKKGKTYVGDIGKNK